MHIPLWQHLFANFQQKHLGKTDGPTAVLRQETSLSCAVLRPQRSTDFPSFDSFQPNFCLFRLYLENITFYLSFQGNLSCFNNFTQFLGIVQKYNLYAIYFCFLLVAPERIPYQIIHEIWTLEEPPPLWAAALPIQTTVPAVCLLGPLWDISIVRSHRGLMIDGYCVYCLLILSR